MSERDFAACQSGQNRKSSERRVNEYTPQCRQEGRAVARNAWVISRISVIVEVTGVLG